MNEWELAYREYDYWELPWYTQKPDELLANLIDQRKILPGKALDLGCGAGTNSIYLASKGFDVIGIDISRTAIKTAKKRCDDAGLLCRFYVGDVLNSDTLGSFNEGSGRFDFVFDRGCFHHIEKEDKSKYVRLVHNNLKSGGKLFLQCFSDKNPSFEKNLSKDDIYHYFSHHFEIKFIKDTIHTEPVNGEKRYMYSVFLEKMN